MIGSKCRKCCACDPTPAQFSLFPSGSPSGQSTVVFHPAGFGGAHTQAITSTFNYQAIATDAVFNFGAAGLVGSASSAATVQFPLWCKADGTEPAATVTLSVITEDAFMATGPVQTDPITVRVLPLISARQPATHIWRPVHPTGQPTGFSPLLIQRHIAAVKIAAALSWPGGTHSTEFFSIPGTAGLIARVELQLSAVMEDDQLSVNVRLGSGGNYSESRVLVGYPEPFSAGGDLAGTIGGGAWHVFPTVTVASQHGYTGVRIARLDSLAGPPQSQPSVSAATRLYPIRATHVAELPTNVAVYCAPGADGYIDPNTTTENGSAPEEPNQYPWFKTPCTRWIKGGRVTLAHSMKNALRLTLPNAVQEPFDTNYDANGLRATFGGTYELSPAADNTFVYRGDLMITASIVVATGGTLPGGALISRPPCPDSNWGVEVVLFFSYVGVDANSGRSGLHAAGVTLGGDAAFLKGAAIAQVVNSVGFTINPGTYDFRFPIRDAPGGVTIAGNPKPPFTVRLV